MNKITKQILFLSLLCLFIISTAPQKNKNLEGLRDFGEKRYAETAPLPYETFSISIKYPDLITNVEQRTAIEDITNYDTFTPEYFNKINLKKYYSQSEMEQDFKYFNNASNLSLYHYFNPVD